MTQMKLEKQLSWVMAGQVAPALPRHYTWMVQTTDSLYEVQVALRTFTRESLGRWYK